MAEKNPEPGNGDNHIRKMKRELLDGGAVGAAPPNMSPWISAPDLLNHQANAVPPEWLANHQPDYGDMLRDASGGGANWLSQEQLDEMHLDLERSKARDGVWLRIACGLVIIYGVYMIYQVVRPYLP